MSSLHRFLISFFGRIKERIQSTECSRTKFKCSFFARSWIVQHLWKAKLGIFANRSKKLFVGGFSLVSPVKTSRTDSVGLQIYLVSFGNPVGVIATHLNELLLKWLQLHAVGGLIAALLCLLYQLKWIHFLNSGHVWMSKNLSLSNCSRTVQPTSVSRQDQEPGNSQIEFAAQQNLWGSTS